MRRRIHLLLILPPFLALLAHAPTLTLGFINMDDPPFVTKNPHILEGVSWNSIKWALTADLTNPSYHTDYWQPMTSLSRLIDGTCWGLDPRGHHLTNLLLHALNAGLLGLFLYKSTDRIAPSVIVGSLFAVHPIHVVSVAWVTERKDVLSLAFLLVTLINFSAWRKNPTRGRFGWMMAAYACSLMSKPLGLPLPLILPFLAKWPCGPSKGPEPLAVRLRTILPAILALSMLAALSASITLHSQRDIFESVSRRQQISNAILTPLIYLKRAVGPTDLAMIHPFPEAPIGLGSAAAGVVLIIAGLFAAFALGARAPSLLSGGAWYLLALLPTLGLVKEAHADRFTYFPLIGIYIAGVFAIDIALSNRVVVQKICTILAAVWLILLAAATRTEIGWWRDSKTLFSRAIEMTGPNPLAERSLGIAQMETGDILGALGSLDRSIAHNPRHASTHHNRGIALERLGRETEALEAYAAAVRVDAEYFSAHYNRAILLSRAGRETEAEAGYLQILSHEPDDIRARNNLGGLYYAMGRFEEARRQYALVLEAAPEHADALSNMGSALFRLGRIEEAYACFERACILDPTNANARQNRDTARRARHAVTP